jgi:hypothetical protein
MNATRPAGPFARILCLLRTPVRLPGWDRRTLRPLPVVIGSAAPLDSRGAYAAAPSTTSANTPRAASLQPPSRITRSLEEVRADLARMRAQARARAEQAQVAAHALAQRQEAERAHRDNGFAPTDFMDFHSPATKQTAQPPHADKPLLDDDVFFSNFAPTDLQDLATTALPRGGVGGGGQ